MAETSKRPSPPTAKTIRVDPDSELGKLLAEAAEMPIILDNGERQYELRPLPRKGPPTPEAVERVRSAIREAAGVWKDFDAEAFKQYLHDRKKPSGTSYQA